MPALIAALMPVAIHWTARLVAKATVSDITSQCREVAHSNRLRLNHEIKRRSDVVGIFPNEAVVTRLIGALLLEQNDEWTVQRARCMTLETITPLSDDPIVKMPALAS